MHLTSAKAFLLLSLFSLARAQEDPGGIPGWPYTKVYNWCPFPLQIWWSPLHNALLPYNNIATNTWKAFALSYPNNSTVIGVKTVESAEFDDGQPAMGFFAKSTEIDLPGEETTYYLENFAGTPLQGHTITVGGVTEGGEACPCK